MEQTRQSVTNGLKPPRSLPHAKAASHARIPNLTFAHRAGPVNRLLQQALRLEAVNGSGLLRDQSRGQRNADEWGRKS